MISDISHVIQLAVAPVFLLAGIGAFVNAFGVRLGRIFDRSRRLEEKYLGSNATQREKIRAELELLARRSRTAYFGIALEVFAALLVCVLIASTFTGYFFGFEVRGLIAGLFSAAMLALTGGLLAFLREIFLAVHSLSTLSPHLVVRNIDNPTTRNHHDCNPWQDHHPRFPGGDVREHPKQYRVGNAQ